MYAVLKIVSFVCVLILGLGSVQVAFDEGV